jgi:hypothetical protein
MPAPKRRIKNPDKGLPLPDPKKLRSETAPTISTRIPAADNKIHRFTFIPGYNHFSRLIFSSLLHAGIFTFQVVNIPAEAISGFSLVLL